MLRTKRIRMPETAPTTRPGFENHNGQVVICDTRWSSSTMAGQRIYRMRCTHCGHLYGSNGCDIFQRKCPAHQGGVQGEPLREPGPGLFDEMERRG